MTREEIRNMCELVDLMLDKCVLKDPRIKVWRRLEEVCDLAIKALEQESSGDLISRQTVLDELSELNIISFYEAQKDSKETYYEIRNAIKQLPSVNLQPNALWQEPCKDVISRQMVIDAMYALCNTGETLKENPWRDNPHIDAIADAIEDLPPVNPQPKTGHWIDDKCSVCGKGTENLISSREWYRNEEPNFCPFCGLKIVDPQESEDKE